MIPNIFHFIWIQGLDQIPAEFEANINSIKKVHGDTVTYMIWDNKKINNFLSVHYPIFEELYKNEQVFAGKSDIARYFILHHYGGIYIDIDTNCMKPINVLLNTDLFYVPSGSNYIAIKNWCLRIPSQYASFEVYNGIFGCKPRHKLFNIIFRKLLERSKHKLLVYRTGPVLFTDAIMEYHKLNPEDANYIIASYWMFAPKELDFIPKQSYIEVTSFMSHESASSWSFANRIVSWVTRTISFWFFNDSRRS